MLAVDPVKRITVPEILQSNFFQLNLPRYLTPPPPRRGPVVGTLASLVSPAKALDFEYIEQLGRIEDDTVQELADSMEDVTVEDIWDALRMDDGVQGNAVKVAYMLLRDKRRLGRDRRSLPMRSPHRAWLMSISGRVPGAGARCRACGHGCPWFSVSCD